jgi:integrase
VARGHRRSRRVVTDKAYTHDELGPTTTHRPRSVALIPAVSAELESLRSSPASLLFASRAGTHLNVNNLRNRVGQPAVGAEGQDGLRPYDGRHTFARAR